MAKLHFGSKEYFEKQSEFWFKENSKHISERDAYKKQRDELINDMAEVKRKAEAFDEMVKIYNQKNDLPSDEIYMKMGYCISDLERGSDE
ncbi:hypothetical protein [Staphylococcus haemolyticus]|uniref:hypothetical protein n=1 Tax=Staphylococcus haemolyticus TaxID=1283 RepID=UPI002649C625|nr:hypothetical protein [Staphylococcus haemolyticus]